MGTGIGFKLGFGWALILGLGLGGDIFRSHIKCKQVFRVICQGESWGWGIGGAGRGGGHSLSGRVIFIQVSSTGRVGKGSGVGRGYPYAGKPMAATCANLQQ